MILRKFLKRKQKEFKETVIKQENKGSANATNQVSNKLK